MNSSKQHFHYLDSARGIAALMVLVYHYIGWKWSDKVLFNVLSMVFNGSDAVSFFFVLSGFVLSYNYFHSNKDPELGSYTIRRIFRLYPAYVFAVMLNYMYWHRHDLNLDLVKNIFWINNDQLWEELFMIKSNHKFFIPGWTLGVEMGVSMVLPLFIMAALRNSKAPYYLIVIGFLAGIHISAFVFHFALGMLAAISYNKIVDFKFSESKWYRYRFLFIAVVFLLYSIRHIERIFPFSIPMNNFQNFFNLNLFHYTGIASFFILIAIVNNKKIQVVLENKILVFLGKISYGIYLMHWLILGIIMEHWEKARALLPGNSFYVDFIGLLIVLLVLTIISATFVYYVIEKPFMQFSKALFSKRTKVATLKTQEV